VSEIKDGGPAFPQLAELGDIAYTTNGMTLRDYFAAKAMQAFIARQGYDMDGETFDDRISRWSYETADAMLKARES
jgi:hypothetical protein